MSRAQVTMRSGTLDCSSFDFILALFVPPWQSPAGEEEMQHRHVCDTALGRLPGPLQQQHRRGLFTYKRGLQHVRKEGHSRAIKQRTPKPCTALGC